MMTYVKASIGEISSGTLRNEDLMRTLCDELEYLANKDMVASRGKFGTHIYAQWMQHNTEARTLISAARAMLESDVDLDTETGFEMLEQIADCLQEYAPCYAYFGAHCGDGACFGFWPDLDAIDELPRVDDPADVGNVGEDCVFVNDHGNLTVYAADGSFIFDCV